MAGIVSAFTGDFIASHKVSEVLIVPLDEDGNIDNVELGGRKVLQYWPEALSDGKGANWQSKDIPGAPLPLYQWVSGGERQFSFTAVFTRDMDGEIGEDVKEDKHNVDIDAAVAWLRMLSANDYAPVGDMMAAVAPPVLWLSFLGTSMGYNQQAPQLGVFERDSGVYCILNQVDVERTNWFPSGIPKFATVALTFSEVMQIGAGIYPYGRDGFKDIANRYTRTYKE